MPPSAKEYREFMEECLRWARTTRSEKHREALIEMAKTWREAAVQLERVADASRAESSRAER